MTNSISTIEGLISRSNSTRAFRDLYYKGVWGIDSNGEMCLKIPTSIALAIATNPATDLFEALAIRYLLDTRLCTQGTDDRDRRAVAGAKEAPECGAVVFRDAIMRLIAEKLILPETGNLNVPLAEAFSMSLDSTRHPIERAILGWKLCEHLSAKGYHNLSQRIDLEFKKAFPNVPLRDSVDDNSSSATRAEITSILTQMEREGLI